jgi:hypothetical protein
MGKSFLQKLIDKSDAILARSTDVELNERDVSNISFSEILGNLDTGGFLILVISIGVLLFVAFIIGANFYYQALPELIYLVAGIPAMLAGLLTWILLFRLKKWLKR